MVLHDWLWPLFLGFVAVVLFIDLFVFHRKEHVISLGEALWTVAGYVALALAFAAGVFLVAGPGRGAEFLTGYLVEQALSFDNIFVIALIFAHFSVPPRAQHRALFYGIAGAIVMRLALIVPGVELVERFAVIGYALGALLLYSGYRMLTSDEALVEPSDIRIVRLLNRTGRCTSCYKDVRFFVRERGKIWMTPLFVVVVAVEITDLVFAADSIPAVLAISNDPFIVFSSNVFAVLGLRALFFVLAGMMREFVYLKSGLALVLLFIGSKMLMEAFLPIPSVVALAVTALLIGGSVAMSLVAMRRQSAVLPVEAPAETENPQSAVNL